MNKFSSLDIWTRFFLLSFCCMALLSFSNIEQSYTPLKYNGPSGLDDLLVHYKEYKIDFKTFICNTYIFHTGSTDCSKQSFFFLYPLFIGVDLMGGLNFSNLYRVTIIFGLISVLLLFLFLKSYWNTRIAFFSCLFYGFSPWFQEMFRTGTYFGPTNLILLLILYTAFKFEEKQNIDTNATILPLLLGILIGISYYYYGLIRGVILFISLMILTGKGDRRRNFSLFSLGVVLILAWGIYLRLSKGGAFIDPENFLIVHKPWISLLKRTYMIFVQIFSPNVEQEHTLGYFKHSRLLHPFLFLPLILGFFVSVTQKQKKYKLFNILSLILYLSILVTSNYQVRRLALLVIPVYTYTGIGFFYIHTCIEKIKSFKQRSKIKILGAVLIIYIVLCQLMYIQKNIFNSDRTFGFLRVAQEIKKHNIEGEVLLLTDKVERKVSFFVKDELFIKIENYKKFAMGTMNVTTVNYYMLQEIVSNKKFSRFCLVITPFCEDKIVEGWIKEQGLNITCEEKINVTSGFKKQAEERFGELKNNYFKILKIEKVGLIE